MTLRYKTSDVDTIYQNVKEFAQRDVDRIVVEDELEDMVGKVKKILEGTLRQLDEVHSQQDLINLCNVTNRLLTLFKC